MPSDPVARKAERQPQRAVTKLMRTGARKKLTLEPELKRPTALPRSLVGNHSLTALMAAGKFPDSPRPRKARATQKPRTEPTSEWLMDDRPQTRMARA
jgi:hypothetical protein